MKIENEFIPYKQALDLKGLGFNEPCLALWHTDKLFSLTGCESHNQYYGQECSAPLKQQAFRFFREKYNIQSYIRPECPDVEPYYDFVIDEEVHDSMNDTYEEAELECLVILIKIVKSKL